SMSWSWQTCEAERCANVVFASSLTPLAAEDYLFSAPANRAATADFDLTFRKLRSMPCDILLTAHPDASGGNLKYARLQRGDRPNPFFEPGACRAYADKYETALRERLAEEAAASSSREGSSPP